jgi:hypothetical protein
MTYNNIQLPSISTTNNINNNNQPKSNNNILASHIEYANKSMQSKSAKAGINKLAIDQNI